MDKHGSSGRLGGRETQPPSSRQKSRSVCTGVRSLQRASKHVYQIAFSFRGVECRELLSLDESKANDKYCERLRSEIVRRIDIGTFNYLEYFPESKRAAVFGLITKKLSGKVGPALKAYKTRSEKVHTHSTYDGYRKSIDNVLIPWCGEFYFHELTPSVIRNWIQEQDTSLKRITNNLLPLRAVMEDAVTDGAIEFNPFDRVKASKLVSPEQREKEEDPDPYTEEELIKILGNIPLNDRWVFQAWAYTGVRTGEQIGVRWDTVDLNAGTVAIVGTTTLGKDKDSTKTKAGKRQFELLPAAREAYGQMRARTQLQGGRVFINARSTLKDKRWNYKRLAAIWKRAHKETQIRYRNPYHLRHTFASNLLTQGENPSFIAKLLGHKNAEMVLRVYAVWIEKGEALGFNRPPLTYGMRRLWDSVGNAIVAA